MNPNKSIAVIAGASRGAGKGIARALAGAVSHIIILGRSSRKDVSPHPLGTIEQTQEELEKLGARVEAYKCDCSDVKQVEEVLIQIKHTHGKIDLLVNAAWGGNDMKPNFGEITDTVEENWYYMFNKGVWNYLLLSCKALPLLKKSSRPLIINISFWDDDKYLGSLFYDLAKNTMNRMALGLAKEMAQQKLIAISLSPGYMKTEKVMDALAKQPELAEKFGVPTESTHYVGEAVKALFQDEEVFAKSGKCLRVGDLAREYGFFDQDGSQPAPFLIPEI